MRKFLFCMANAKFTVLYGKLYASCFVWELYNCFV